MGYYNMPSGSLQDLQMQMALLDKLKATQEMENQTGGPGGRMLEYQRKKGYDQAAQQLENFLKISQAYPTVQPPPQIQQAGNIVTGGPLGQISAGMGFPQKAQTPLIPAMSPWLNKTQAEIDAYKMKAPVETQMQYDQMKKLMDMLGIPEASRPEYMLRYMGVSREPGQKTEYQKENQANRKQALLMQIKNKKIYDPTTLGYTDVKDPKTAWQAVSQLAMQYGLDVNDPDIQSAVAETFATPAKKEGGWKWPWSKSAETQTPVQKGEMQPAKGQPSFQPTLPKIPKLQKFITRHARNKAFYDQAIQQGYTEADIDAFLTEKGIE